jgi:hypothetical protein
MGYCRTGADVAGATAAGSMAAAAEMRSTASSTAAATAASMPAATGCMSAAAVATAFCGSRGGGVGHGRQRRCKKNDEESHFKRGHDLLPHILNLLFVYRYYL